MLLFVNLKPPRTRRFTKGSEEHLRLAPPNPTDHALFFVPNRNLPAFAGNAEVGSNQGQDRKPTGQ